MTKVLPRKEKGDSGKWADRMWASLDESGPDLPGTARDRTGPI